jgi:orotate phosphoribosyltransferase
MVRKNGGNDTNSGMWVEGNTGAKRVVVIDDLICSGKTMGQMMHALRFIRKTRSHNLKIVGLLLHMDYKVNGSTGPHLYLPTDECDSKFQRMIGAERERDSPTLQHIKEYNPEPMYTVPSEKRIDV